MPKPWYSKGLRFECTRCGNCCTNNGDYSHVYVSDAEATAIADYLGTTRAAFLEEHCEVDEGWTVLRLGEDRCQFLNEEGKCDVYPVRPAQCSTWPFWHENLERETWNGPVKEICPGIDRGRLYSIEEITASADRADEWRREEED